MVKFHKSPYRIGFLTAYRPGKRYRGIRWALDRRFAGWELDHEFRRVTLGRLVIDY